MNTCSPEFQKNSKLVFQKLFFPKNLMILSSFIFSAPTTWPVGSVTSETFGQSVRKKDRAGRRRKEGKGGRRGVYIPARGRLLTKASELGAYVNQARTGGLGGGEASCHRAAAVARRREEKAKKSIGGVAKKERRIGAYRHGASWFSCLHLISQRPYVPSSHKGISYRRRIREKKSARRVIYGRGWISSGLVAVDLCGRVGNLVGRVGRLDVVLLLHCALGWRCCAIGTQAAIHELLYDRDGTVGASGLGCQHFALFIDDEDAACGALGGLLEANCGNECLGRVAEKRVLELLLRLEGRVRLGAVVGETVDRKASSGEGLIGVAEEAYLLSACDICQLVNVRRARCER